MPFDAEDRAVFFDADMPGHVLVMIDGMPVDALDRRQGFAESFGIIAGSAPSLLVSEAVTVDRGSSVVITPDAYVVTDVREDGPGRKRIIMEST